MGKLIELDDVVAFLEAANIAALQYYNMTENKIFGGKSLAYCDVLEALDNGLGTTA